MSMGNFPHMILSYAECVFLMSYDILPVLFHIALLSFPQFPRSYCTHYALHEDSFFHPKCNVIHGIYLSYRDIFPWLF